jgi:hypothetical protein
MVLPVLEQLISNDERITKNDAAERKFLVLLLMMYFFPADILVEIMLSSMTTLTHFSLRGLSPTGKPVSPSRPRHRSPKTLGDTGSIAIYYFTVTLTVAAIWAP